MYLGAFEHVDKHEQTCIAVHRTIHSANVRVPGITRSYQNEKTIARSK